MPSSSAPAPTAASEFSDALRQFFRAARRARGRAAQRAGADGELSLAQYQLLDALLDGPLTVGQLAAEGGVASPTATRMLDVLLRQGHVVRGEDPDDRRAVVVSLTEQGRAAVLAKRAHMDEARRRIAERLDEDEQRRAAALLRQLAEVIEEI